MKKLNKVYHIDAREIETIIDKPIVDVTITSPPYFDLKDYGSRNQIGYGQDYANYLNDLKFVFGHVYNITKENGTLWVIIDAFRRDGEVVPLPFDFSNTIKEIGWKLQEIIIWGKDRTVPWTHKGQMRNLFEYVLMFSKTNDYNFYIDKVRDFETLKKWWVKYPERYNPKGKTPDAIWNFDIPTQGSWGNGYIKHFCPLPEEMIEQMLKLTTKENDLVLDCFAGSGAVLSKADNMKRKYIGTELNKDYINMFETYLQNTGEKKRAEYEKHENNQMKQHKFQKLILDLRALKFARVFYQKLMDGKTDEIERIYVEKSKAKPEKTNSLIVVNYYILIKNPSKKLSLELKLQKLSDKAPLSKFGIEPIFHFTSSQKKFNQKFEEKKVFFYSSKVTHKYIDTSNHPHSIASNMKKALIISKIMVDLDEKDYE